MISYVGKDKIYMDGMKYHSNIVLVGVQYDINDFVVYKERYGTKEHKAKIYYSKRENRAYFNAKDGRHYVDNFMNVYGM